MDQIRFIFRLFCIGGCLLYGMAEMFFLFPFYSKKRKLRAIQIWSLRVLASCGMKLKTYGKLPSEEHGQMLICNHISWLDIMAVNAAFPGRFVAKDDVAKWPVIGYLATQAQTVYVARNKGTEGNSEKIRRVTEALQNGWELYGNPTLTFDGEHIICGQAVVKESDGGYDPEKPLSEY